MRGGEKCLEVFCRLFPQADLFTLLHLPGRVSPVIESHRIVTSFLQRLPGAENNYRNFLPLMPAAIESLDFRGYDLILSSSHCVAKAAKADRGAKHLCYCFTPMRYIWDQFDVYFNAGYSKKSVYLAMRAVRPWLQKWDVRTSRRVDRFVAISRFVQKRIKNCYGRESDVIYPPVDGNFFKPLPGSKVGDYFLIVSALAPYKRIDLAVEAFNELGYPLKIVGRGPNEPYLKSIARPNIEFLGGLTDEEILSCYAGCRAFIFPGVEDFGITPLEAQAMGRPVIAFGQGGVLETVVPDPETWKPEIEIPENSGARHTGVFFHEATPESLCLAVKHFEKIEYRFDPEPIRAHAMQFDLERFSNQISQYIGEQVPSLRC